jgi:hypothetical protein
MAPRSPARIPTPVELLKSRAAEAARLAEFMAAPAIEALLTAGLLTPDNIERLRQNKCGNFARALELQRQRHLLASREH